MTQTAGETVSLLHIRQDPATRDEIFNHIQQEGPVFYPEANVWAIAGHAAVHDAFRDTETYLNKNVLYPMYPFDEGRIFGILGPGIGHLPNTTAACDDHGLHRKVRQAASASFATTPNRLQDDSYTRKVIADLAVEVTGDLPSYADEHGVVDLAPHLAERLPLTANMKLIGFKPHQYGPIQKAARGQIDVVWGDPTPDEKAEFAQGLVDLAGACQDLTKDRMAAVEAAKATGQDPKTVFADAHDMATRLALDGRLNEYEMTNLLLNMAVAGFKTTEDGIKEFFYNVLSREGAWEDLVANRHDDAYVQALVDSELDRNPPIDGWRRTLAKAVEINGKQLPAGAELLLLLRAANNDPHRPRSDGPIKFGKESLTFGSGEHFCLGAAVARYEMRLVAQNMAEQYPDLQLAPGYAEEPNKYRPNAAFSDLEKLPVIGIGRVALAGAHQP